MEKQHLLFFFTPTMQCNFRCSYCFLSNDLKSEKKTMFDRHTVEEWSRAMGFFQEYDVEFYMWGGEPFFLEDTYTLVREWCAMDHVISGCRIDTNVFYAEKIARLCPSSKVKLNCSYHMEYHTLEEQFRKIKLLKSLDMVGMVNFVASASNLHRLKQDYHMAVDDLIEKFGEIGVFVNIAGDFNITNDPAHPDYERYKAFIQRYTSPEDWKFLRSNMPPGLPPTKCTAGQSFFNVDYDGTISNGCTGFCSEYQDRQFGNFLEGKIWPMAEEIECGRACTPIVAYSFRCDNDFRSRAHLLDYAARCERRRKQRQNQTI